MTMRDTGHRQLVTSRVIAASPERLFAAWTMPDQLLRWWGPPGGQCVDAQADVRVGGTYRLENRTAGGELITISGTFTEVSPPTVITYTWQVDPGPAHRELVTVSFTRCGGGTRVVIRHDRIADEAIRREHARGWASCLDRLTEWV
jgi:uncharacterized protein YndB with AHSA1/START domain